MFDTIVKILLTIALAGILIAILPASPFASIIESLEAIPYLGYLNWLFPVGRCISVMFLWCGAILIYYGIAWILRQLGIIGG